MSSKQVLPIKLDPETMRRLKSLRVGERMVIRKPVPMRFKLGRRFEDVSSAVSKVEKNDDGDWFVFYYVGYEDVIEDDDAKQVQNPFGNIGRKLIANGCLHLITRRKCRAKECRRVWQFETVVERREGGDDADV